MSPRRINDAEFLYAHSTRGAAFQFALITVSSIGIAVFLALNLAGNPGAFTGVVIPVGLAVNDASENDSHSEFSSFVKPFLQQYCGDCHFGDGSEGEIDLSQIEMGALDEQQLQLLASVREALAESYMPPQEMDQPEIADKQKVQKWIRQILASKTEPAPVLMRRLSRVQYENTIKELLRLNVDVFDNPQRILQNDDYFQPSTRRMPRYVLAISYFSYAQRNPPDMPGVATLPTDPPVEHGFNNEQGALSISPMLLEQYLETAYSIVDNQNFPKLCGMWQSLFVFDHVADLDKINKHARRRLAVFLPRAFRRPITQQELNRYLNLFEYEHSRTTDYTQAMKITVSSILVSPNFLFRDEFSELATPPESKMVQTHLQPYDDDLIDDYLMASRLSYFLWGSMPDDHLFRSAAEGRLNDPIELENQVRRMMVDRKIKSLSSDFGMQWLQVQKVLSVKPDRTKFPTFYHNRVPPPSISMMIEQLLLFETIMIENRSILDFIKTDTGYLNRNLMDWYHLDPVKTIGYKPTLQNYEDFFRIQWPNEHRGGVLTSGAMLASTSATDRTSPVYRGNWVLDVIFNRPPPPAPANVPPLSAEDSHNTELNVREQLAIHRKDTACAACHDRIDPMGLALENFDAVGRFRTKYPNGETIDSSGEINGMAFEGAARFKNAILKDKEKFVRAFVEHAMKYALGRMIHVSDDAEVERITKHVLANDSRFSNVITEIVLSKPFRRMVHSIDIPDQPKIHVTRLHELKQH